MEEKKKVYVLLEFYEEPHGGIHLAAVSTDKEVVLKAAKEKFKEHEKHREIGRMFGHKKLFRATLMFAEYDSETGLPAFDEVKKQPEYYMVTEDGAGNLVFTNFMTLHGDCREHMKKQPE